MLDVAKDADIDGVEGRFESAVVLFLIFKLQWTLILLFTLS